MKATLSPLIDLQAISLAGLRNSLRPGQREMADWQGGPLAVSAVPGAGKSHGMAVAAAIAIAQNQLHRQRQLVVVTFTRSAAANLKARIRQYLRTLQLPQGGFVVHTLHGLALNIATRYPELSGLSLNSATLVSPNQSHRVIRACVEQWVANNPRLYQVLLEGRQFDGEETERLRRQSVLRTEVLPTLAHTVIHEAKSSGLLPADLRVLSEQTVGDLVLAIAAGLYEHYQSLLRLRNLIDYDDMILAALRVLENAGVRQLWQNQVFAVFEDEAQDSTPLQARLLEILATAASGDGDFGVSGSAEGSPRSAQLSARAQAEGSNEMGSWGVGGTGSNLKSKINLVRVGDSNQAINSTFTPADPIFFRRFCEDCKSQGRLATMAQAGRSSQTIIDAANFALEWVNRSFDRGMQIAPFRPQSIYPVSSDDPQVDANPISEGQGLELYTPRDIYHTIQLIAHRVADLLTRHPQAQAAVLVRENKQGRFVSQVLANPSQYGVVDLSQSGIEVYDVGERDRHSRVPAEILALLQFIDRPHSPDYLKTALGVLVERQLIPNQDLNLLTSLPEQFLYPGPLDPPQSEPVCQARHLCSSLLRARIELPHYQLISFVALALKYNQAELATADKLAERVTRQTTGEASMAATLNVLNDIVRSERFEPVETEDTEKRFTRSGQLTIITMHKAKGLDWDYVFLPFLHEQTIPGSPWTPSQSQFIGDFTLAEVARAQIRASLHGQYPLPEAAAAWEQAKHLKIAEEFRLLYVAMTRAKRLLWMAAARKAPFWGTFNWNKQNSLSEKKPCPILQPLKTRFPSSVCAC